MPVEVSPSTFLLIVLVAITPLALVMLNEVEHRYRATRDPLGCRKLGLFIRSHLHDQHHSRYSSAQAKNKWTVKALFVYPVKSCYPVELNRGDVVRTGLKYDRQFSFAQRMPASEKEGEKWQFITQRQFPKMTQIKTEVWVPDPDSPAYKKELGFVEHGGCVKLSFPSSPAISFGPNGLKAFARITLAKLRSFNPWAKPTISFMVPFNPSKDRIAKKAYPVEQMAIWNESPKAYNVTSEINPAVLDELRIFLGVSNPLALFRTDPNKPREVYRNAPGKDIAGYQPVTGFADAYALHIINIASVQDVASHLPRSGPKAVSSSKLDAIRFRANIYVTGPKAYEEDHWSRITIGGKLYDVCSRCVRCKLPNNDPESGVPHAIQPLSAMNEFRRIDEGAKYSPCLGMNAVPIVEEGEEAPKSDNDTVAKIKVGDEIKLLSTREHLYIKQ